MKKSTPVPSHNQAAENLLLVTKIFCQGFYLRFNMQWKSRLGYVHHVYWADQNGVLSSAKLETFASSALVRETCISLSRHIYCLLVCACATKGKTEMSVPEAEHVFYGYGGRLGVDCPLRRLYICKSELENNVWSGEFCLNLTPKYGIREAYWEEIFY